MQVKQIIAIVFCFNILLICRMEYFINSKVIIDVNLKKATLLFMML